MTDYGFYLLLGSGARAIGALSALRDEGIEVPREMAVAGFDDIPIARHMSPALSSVHVPIAELGKRACKRLIDALARPEEYEARHEVLRTTLVIRASCGPQGHN